jgi:hypothetical protein
MSDYLVQQVRSTKNIEVRLGAEVIGGDGGERLESVEVLAKTSGTHSSYRGFRTDRGHTEHGLVGFGGATHFERFHRYRTRYRFAQMAFGTTTNEL